MRGWRPSLPAAAAALLLTLPASAQDAAEPEVDYRTAELLLSWHTRPLLAGGEVEPEWIDGSDRFWYRTTTGSGYRFMYTDPERDTHRPLFDHYRLAAAMSMATDTAFAPGKLPFEEFEFVDDDEGRIEFRATKRRWVCDIREYRCQVGDTLPPDEPFVESPDEHWEAFVQDHDVYIRPSGGGDTIRLTTDGEEFYAYGLDHPRPNEVKDEEPRRPAIFWSPDSRKLAVERRDERGVEHHHYVSYTPRRPEHYSQPYALPGDSVIPHPTFHVLDVEDRTNVKVEVTPRPAQLSLRGSAVDSLWSADSGRLYVTWLTRASKSAFLGEVDAATGEVTILASDSSRTFVELGQRNPPSWYVVEDGDDVFWWSERDGWAHIWRHGRDGRVKGQVTSGPWAVGAIRAVDVPNRRLYFTAYGREEGLNPYYAQLYRVGFDGSGLQRVSPEDGHHELATSPSGAWMVDVHSEIGRAPVSLLRRTSDAGVVRTLEEADPAALEGVGWRAPEIVTVKARDGVTDVWGLVYLPPDLDPDRKYPVIDHIYPGPQVGSVGSWTFKGGGESFALAELGFVVVELDHMGTPHRSKAFHDAYYGDFNDNGLPDHVTGIKQLAARYPFMDLDRVGIYGHSGGAFASTDAMLTYPDFFKVAVSSSGNHDNASYNIYWAEKYQGLMERDTVKGTDNFEPEANATHAENLEGKLLLMHGDMDDNVHPAMTIQLIDALTEANRDYDLIWAPDRAHGLNEPYFIRRRWDYFVRHLMGREPPKEYRITRPSG